MSREKEIREKVEALLKAFEAELGIQSIVDELKVLLRPSREEIAQDLQAVLKNYTSSNKEYKTITYAIEELKK